MTIFLFDFCKLIDFALFCLQFQRNIITKTEVCVCIHVSLFFKYLIRGCLQTPTIQCYPYSYLFPRHQVINFRPTPLHLLKEYSMLATEFVALPRWYQNNPTNESSISKISNRHCC